MAADEPREEPWTEQWRVDGNGEPLPPPRDIPWEEMPGDFTADLEDGSKVILSKARVLVEDRLLPKRVVFKFPLAAPHVTGEPWMAGKVEVLDGVPQCTHLSFVSENGGREVRQSDLRAVEVNSFVIDLMAGLSLRIEQAGASEAVIRAAFIGLNGPGDAFIENRRFMERRRRPTGLRDITPQLLERVAQVYRDNISRAPTQAVAKAFGVKSRMASNYVQRARAAGYLPPTKQGKKQA